MDMQSLFPVAALVVGVMAAMLAATRATGPKKTVTVIPVPVDLDPDRGNRERRQEMMALYQYFAGLSAAEMKSALLARKPALNIVEYAILADIAERYGARKDVVAAINAAKFEQHGALESVH